MKPGPGREFVCFFGKPAGKRCTCECHDAAGRLRLLANGAIVDDSGRQVARVVHADEEMGEAMRAAAELVWRKRKGG